jgi:polyisoprenoid-binding protein YceI
MASTEDGAPPSAAAAAAARLRDPAMVGAWELDPQRSSVEFRVRHFWGMVTVRGHFTKFEGAATIDRSGAISGSMRIDAGSVETKQPRRDGHLRSADFFDADNHPTISFSTRTVSPLGDDLVAVVGELTAAGRARPIEFEARIAEATAERLIARAEITIDRFGFGMTWSPLRTASPTVLVTVHGELARSS